MADNRHRKGKPHKNQRHGNISTSTRWEREGVLKERLQLVYDMASCNSPKYVIAEALEIGYDTFRNLITVGSSTYDMRVLHAYISGQHVKGTKSGKFLTEVIDNEEVDINARIRVAEKMYKDAQPFFHGGTSSTSELLDRVDRLEQLANDYKSVINAKDDMIAELRSQLDYYYSSEEEEPESSGEGVAEPVGFAVTVPEEDGDGCGCKDETEEVRTDTED